MLVLFFLCMLCIHHHGHAHMTIVLEDACTVLFRTWWVFECLLPIMRWKLEPDDLVWDSEPAAEMKADNWRNRAASAASCLISRNRIRPFKFQQFFIQHNKNSFFGFVCQLIQQQHLKRLEACFWIWEWFRSRDGNALYPYVKCPKCFSETINKNKQPLRLNYQYYKLSRITVWDPRKNLWYVLSCYY